MQLNPLRFSLKSLSNATSVQQTSNCLITACDLVWNWNNDQLGDNDELGKCYKSLT